MEKQTNTAMQRIGRDRQRIWDVPFCPTEFAWTSFDRQSKKYTCINHGFIHDEKEPIRQHPTAKPLPVFIGIISDFAKENDLILDPFLGSGTTLVAAKNLGRRAIGIEINLDYCRIAEDRLRQEVLSL